MMIAPTISPRSRAHKTNHSETQNDLAVLANPNNKKLASSLFKRIKSIKGRKFNFSSQGVPMGFNHLPVKGNPPLIASYCLKCKSFVAVSGKEETLLMT